MRQEFFINAIPTGQGRPKFARIGNHVHTYDPARSRNYKLDIKYQVMDKHPKKMEGPLTMVIDFLMPRPKSHYNKKGLKKDAPVYHTSRPDIDNMLKACLDALKGILWNDDTQLSVVMATKKYSEFVGINIIVQDCE